MNYSDVALADADCIKIPKSHADLLLMAIQTARDSKLDEIDKLAKTPTGNTAALCFIEQVDAYDFISELIQAQSDGS